MNENLFKNPSDYWRVAETVKHLYMSDGSMSILLDFERVLDEMDMYAFRNWLLGELVEGPEISKYAVSCTFMWPYKMMPDPKAGKRLLQFGCKVNYQQSSMKVPIKVTEPDDFEADTKMPKLVDKKIWLVEIIMPKELVTDIRTGSVELEGETIDLEDLDLAYEQDVQNSEVIDDTQSDLDDELETQSAEDDDFGFGEEM